MKLASSGLWATVTMAVATVGVWGQASAAPHDDAAPPKAAVEDIRACMSNNFVDRGSLRDIGLQTTDREGKISQLKMRLFWKPSKDGDARLNLRVLEPEDLKGSSYLMVESTAGEALYYYLPASDKVQKLSGGDASRPLWGTDFSYGELKQVQGLLATGVTVRKPDQKLGERPVFVLETATAGDANYQKVTSYVDRASCVLLKSEFVAKNGKPRKVLEADVSTLTSIDIYWFVLGYTMKDLKQNTQTKLTLSDIYLLERKGEKLFDPENFWKTAE